jgi:hypothetical protein
LPGPEGNAGSCSPSGKRSGGVVAGPLFNTVWESFLVTKRKSETEEELKQRLKQKNQKAVDAEDALDAMVRRSILIHGP